MAWGGGKPPWPPPPLGDWISQGRRPPRGLYKGGQGRGQRTLCPGASLSLSNTSSSSVRARRSPAGVLQFHHHHAVVLLLESSSPTSPLPCWIKKKETLR